MAGSGSTPSSSSMARARSVTLSVRSLVVGAQGGGDGQPVGPFRVGIEGQGPFGVDQGVRRLAPHEAQFAELEEAVELEQADPLDLVLLADDEGQIGERLAPPPGRGRVEHGDRAVAVAPIPAAVGVATQPPELPQVDDEVLGRLQRDGGGVGAEVERGLAGRPFGFEELAEVGQRDAQVAGAAGGVVLGPEQLGDGVAGERAVDDEQREQGADAGATQLGRGDGDAVEGHDERAEDRDLEPPRRHRRQAGQQVGGGPTDGARLAGEVAQLGPGRLGHLVDQPLGQPEAARRGGWRATGWPARPTTAAGRR